MVTFVNGIPLFHRLTRREMFRLMAGAAVGVVSGACARLGSLISRNQSNNPSAASTPGTPSCVVRPQQTEGPFFVDARLNRRDIRSDPSTGALKAGVPLRLSFRVSRVAGNSCTPVANAVVDVWHCDALGVYSDVQDPRFNTRGMKFLRGYQVTDQSGVAQFETIYPGWYMGRTVHIHFKIRTDPSAQRGFEFTSQLYFDDMVTNRVFAQPPYNTKGRRGMVNADDGIFRNGGDQLILPLRQEGQGYVGIFDIGLQLS